MHHFVEWVPSRNEGYWQEPKTYRSLKGNDRLGQISNPSFGVSPALLPIDKRNNSIMLLKPVLKTC